MFSVPGNEMDVDAQVQIVQPMGISEKDKTDADMTDVTTAVAATTDSIGNADARRAAATTAACQLPAVRHEDLDEESAAQLLIQPRENPLQVAARCISRLPAVVRRVLSGSASSDENFFFAAQATSRIVACYPHILPLVLRHFRTSKSLLSLLEGAPSLQPQEAADGQMCIINILKTALRFYEAAADCMLHMWEWTPVARVLASPVELERALGVRVVSMILHLTEKESAQLASSLDIAGIREAMSNKESGGLEQGDEDEEDRIVLLSSLFAHDVAAERAPAALDAWRESLQSSTTGVDLGGVLLERELDGGDVDAETSYAAMNTALEHGDAVRGGGGGGGR